MLKINDFTIISKLGKGGQGTVYRANSKFYKQCALKTLPLKLKKLNQKTIKKI